MKRRGCLDCQLIEPTPGAWLHGLCPPCTEARARKAETAPTPPPPPKTSRDPALEATAARLQRMVSDYTKDSPQTWRALDAMRQANLTDWPPWCFLPVSVLGGYVQAMNSVSGIAPKLTPLTPSMSGHVHGLALLGAWRTTQGLYRYDPDVMAALWTTPLEGKLPVEFLYRLPEWCVYIETPDRALSTGERLLGFFAHLDYVKETEHHLRLGLDIQDGPMKILPITLRGSLPEALADMERDYRDYREKYGPVNEYLDRIAEQMQYGAEDLAPLISVLLYLCSTNAEMRERRTGRLRPRRPTLTKTKDGMRMFPAEKSSTWEIAYRLGAAIRHARESQPSKPGDGIHASPRPHVRRAHWHAFWTGPKAKPGIARTEERKLLLHWLPPIPVNVEDEAPVVPTLHEVKS